MPKANMVPRLKKRAISKTRTKETTMLTKGMKSRRNHQAGRRQILSQQIILKTGINMAQPGCLALV